MWGLAGHGEGFGFNSGHDGEPREAVSWDAGGGRHDPMCSQKAGAGGLWESGGSDKVERRVGIWVCLWT